jgi:catechol 2,3-dioxygenase-like lactoylglutathione lyase family enzyme
MPTRPRIRGIAEAVLYTDDIIQSRRFFEEVLGLDVIFTSDTLLVFDAGTAQALLVFLRGATDEGIDHPGGFIPGHRGEGPAHLAFHVSLADYEAWKEVLGAAGVAILSEVKFGACGLSLYFNDPAGNVLELATPGHWQNF